MLRVLDHSPSHQFCRLLLIFSISFLFHPALLISLPYNFPIASCLHVYQTLHPLDVHPATGRQVDGRG